MKVQSAIRPRNVLLPISVGTALSLIGDASLYTVLPTHFDDALVPLASVGILLSANRFIRLILNWPAGLVYDRWPRRRLFVPALFIGALSTGLYALTQGFWPLLVGRLLWGLSWTGIWIGGNTIIMDITQAHNRGRWVGFYQTSFFLGASSGAFLGGVLTDWLGYHGAMTIAAGLTLFGAAYALLFLPETFGLRSSSPISDRSASQATVVTGARPFRWSELVSAIALYGLNRLVVAGVLLSTFGLFLFERFGETVRLANLSLGVATVTGIGLGTTSLISMVTAPAIGTFSDRAHNRWLAVAGGLMPGIMGFALIASGAPPAIFIGIPLVAIASGSNQGLSTTLVGDLSRVRLRGRWLGVLFTIGDFASAVGPPAAYALLPTIGLNSTYLLSAGLLVLMLLVAVRWTLPVKVT